MTAPASAGMPEVSVDDAPAAASAIAEPAAPATAPSGARRRIERVTPAAGARPPARPGRGPSNAAALFRPPEGDDAAIPFDRVPYVPSDLRRVAIMAGFMVLLIIVAALIVSHTVG